MIDQADANAVEPAEAPEQILIDLFIGEKYSTEISWARPGRAPDRASAVSRATRRKVGGSLIAKSFVRVADDPPEARRTFSDRTVVVALGYEKQLQSRRAAN
jgi:hypothetical protein